MNVGRKVKRELLIVALVFGGILAAWYISELSYARRIAPVEISTIGDYFDQFGEPRAVRLVVSKGESFYEFVGAHKAPLSFAVPSSPPAYIFDEAGRFVTWSKDPGDDRRHRENWPLQRTNRVAIWGLKQKFWPPASNFGYAALSDRELGRLKEAVVTAANTPATWEQLGVKRLTDTPFRFNMTNAQYHVYFEKPDSIDILIPSGGTVGWHACFVRATVRRDTSEVVAIEESFWP